METASWHVESPKWCEETGVGTPSTYVAGDQKRRRSAAGRRDGDATSAHPIKL